MKKYFLAAIMLLLLTSVYSQKGYGIDVGYAPARTLMGDVRYFVDENVFSLGFTYKFNNAQGTREAAIIPGTTIITDGNYFFSVDLGYTRIVSEKFGLEGEVSVGSKKHFTNLRDDNFSSGAYHVIDKTSSVFGLGGIVHYTLTNRIGLFAGYNSLRKAVIGLQVKFLPNSQ